MNPSSIKGKAKEKECFAKSNCMFSSVAAKVSIGHFGKDLLISGLVI